MNATLNSDAEKAFEREVNKRMSTYMVHALAAAEARVIIDSDDLKLAACRIEAEAMSRAADMMLGRPTMQPATSS